MTLRLSDSDRLPTFRLSDFDSDSHCHRQREFFNVVFRHRQRARAKALAGGWRVAARVSPLAGLGMVLPGLRTWRCPPGLRTWQACCQGWPAGRQSARASNLASWIPPAGQAACLPCLLPIDQNSVFRLAACLYPSGSFEAL